MYDSGSTTLLQETAAGFKGISCLAQCLLVLVLDILRHNFAQCLISNDIFLIDSVV